MKHEALTKKRRTITLSRDEEGHYAYKIIDLDAVRDKETRLF
jgi:hypothetical protein